MKKTFKVAVEGNVGAGKSTFLSYFDGISSNIEVLPEPIQQWKDAKGYNLYELFYSDPAKWNIPFRSHLMVTIINQQSKPQMAPVRLIERSIHSNRHCFMEALKTNNMITGGDFQFLDYMYRESCQLSFVGLDLIVYLRSSPEVCFDRIHQRNRPGEHSISFEYLQQLHHLHDDWLLGGNAEISPSVPVLVFDCTEPLETLTTTYYAQRKKIMCGVDV